jgi:hypothetical protein
MLNATICSYCNGQGYEVCVGYTELCNPFNYYEPCDHCAGTGRCGCASCQEDSKHDEGVWGSEPGSVRAGEGKAGTRGEGFLSSEAARPRAPRFDEDCPF